MAFNFNNPLSNEDDGLSWYVINFVKNNFYFFTCLIVILVVSCMLISKAQDSRKNNIRMNQELKHQDKIVQEYQHLRLERQTLTEYSHVRTLAKENLKMSDPGVENKKVIDVRSSGGNSK